MNPAQCDAEGGERPRQKRPKHLLVFADYRKPGGAVLSSCRVDSPYHSDPTEAPMAATKGRKEGKVHVHNPN